MVWLFTTKYGENVKFCYMDTDDGFIAHVKTYDIYKDIAEDVEKKKKNWHRHWHLFDMK